MSNNVSWDLSKFKRGILTFDGKHRAEIVDRLSESNRFVIDNYILMNRDCFDIECLYKNISQVHKSNAVGQMCIWMTNDYRRELLRKSCAVTSSNI